MHAQEQLGIARGTIRATVLIETILAAFEMDEILWELREHSAGLNCGRWDYMFSIIKKFRHRPDFVLPDRAQVTMTRHFMSSYVDLLIATCHRRWHPRHGRHGRADPHQERSGGQRSGAAKGSRGQAPRGSGRPRRHLGGPSRAGAVAKESSTRYMPSPTRSDRKRDDVHVTAADLLTVPAGDITEAGSRSTSTSVFSIWSLGWAATAACPFTT